MEFDKVETTIRAEFTEQLDKPGFLSENLEDKLLHETCRIDLSKDLLNKIKYTYK